MNKEELQEIINKTNSMAELFIALGYSSNPNSRTRAKIRAITDDLEIYDIPKIYRDRKKKPEYASIECPVCEVPFVPKRSSSNTGIQVTCSLSCSNKYFRSGENHWMYKTGKSSYRNLGLNTYGHKCAVCDESLLVQVHHIDKDRDNNSIDNLIVLCPTHHEYLHSEHIDVIKPLIDEYLLTRFINTGTIQGRQSIAE